MIFANKTALSSEALIWMKNHVTRIKKNHYRAQRYYDFILTCKTTKYLQGGENHKKLREWNCDRGVDLISL